MCFPVRILLRDVRGCKVLTEPRIELADASLVRKTKPLGKVNYEKEIMYSGELELHMPLELSGS